MARLKSLVLAVTTVAIALLLGYRVQYAGAPEALDLASVRISDVALTSSARSAARPPEPPMDAAPAAIDPADPPGAAIPAQASRDCPVDIEAMPGAGATVTLQIDAPCQGGNRVTLHHQGLVVTETMTRSGALSVSLPALSEQAVFLAEFPDGSGGTASAQVNSLPFYDRVVLQWSGPVALELHALEFGAAYFEDGHVWAGATGDLAQTARGEGGFMTVLGDPDQPGARQAQIYSFPAGTAQRGGTVQLSVEAQLTEETCGRAVEAQTLQRMAGGALVARTLDVQLPECGAAAQDFLVLKNLVEDLTIATR